MQVSWIDANHLQSLLAQIAPPETCAEAEPPGMLEIASVLGFMDDAAAPAAPLEPMEPPALASSDAAIPIEPAADENAEEDEEDEPHGKILHNSAAALPLSRIRDKLRAIRQRATDAGILTRVCEPAMTESAAETASSPPVDLEMLATPAPSQAGPALEIPHGSCTDRLAAFAAWTRQVLHESGGHVLVMSDDGEVLWGGEARAGLVLSTMMAWGAAIRASAASGCGKPPVIRQPLSSGHVLTVIPCETKSGIFHAAVAAPDGLTDELAAVLHDALRDTMNADGSTS
ncbi:MAG TPA: hypothetical protein DDZ88_01180 [Verrucomicrobiales bacterium]|nr:hypothetical protein [Verrucomicrobiales bacterium]